MPLSNSMHPIPRPLYAVTETMSTESHWGGRYFHSIRRPNWKLGVYNWLKMYEEIPGWNGSEEPTFLPPIYNIWIVQAPQAWLWRTWTKLQLVQNKCIRYVNGEWAWKRCSCHTCQTTIRFVGHRYATVVFFCRNNLLGKGQEDCHPRKIEVGGN